MDRKFVELWVGVFVAAGLAALAMLAFKVGNLSAGEVVNAYRVTAQFDNIGGLKVKAPVTLAGVRIGRVSNIVIDKQRYRAVVELSIEGNYDNLPKDSSASILTSGLLGDQYIGLEPGGSEENLKSGDQIMTTTSALVLEKLIGQFLFGKASEQEAPKNGAPTNPVK
jgi:phospholipid/cholesterol/gamma-HCH transport system substrate-binding protein